MSLGTRLGALRRLDWSLFTASVLLAAIGLAALYSVTINVENPDYSQFIRQAVFMGVGIVALLVFSVIDFRVWWSASWALYGFGALLLVGVLLFGQTIRGTTGWFTFFGQTFQPVELARIFLVIQLSRFFATRTTGRSALRVLIGSGALTALYIGLLVLQPEFGYSALFFGVWFVTLLIAKIPRWQIVALTLVVIAVAVFSWFFVLQGYQKDRIDTFLHPSADQYGKNYNIIQSIVAIGSGGVFGRGLGLGPQSQLNFLPEQATDFIFAVIAEELGFFGAMIVIGAFTLLFARLYRAIRRSKDAYTGYLLSGFFLLLFFQMFVNIGMNLGLLPVTGIPLPFVSYGGSALLTNFCIIGIVQSIILRQPTDWKP